MARRIRSLLVAAAAAAVSGAVSGCETWQDAGAAVNGSAAVLYNIVGDEWVARNTCDETYPYDVVSRSECYAQNNVRTWSD